MVWLLLTSLVNGLVNKKQMEIMLFTAHSLTSLLQPTASRIFSGAESIRITRKVEKIGKGSLFAHDRLKQQRRSSTKAVFINIAQ